MLLEVGGNKVKLSEFEAIYKKNNQSATIDRKDLEEYLELFINFKLKVREAEALGMDTIKKFKDELAGYRRELAAPYLTDKSVTEELIKEGYDRLGWEIRASHILLKCGADALPKDTLKIYNTLMELRKRIMKGEDFNIIAAESSQDPSATKNKGDLGWFSGFYMVYPFENAAYNTKPGEISMPVRTRFGYHLVKVVDKRKARGQMRAAHIMVRIKPDANEEEMKQAETKINEIYTELMADPSKFGDLAMKYSDDKGSARRGGELQTFGTGRMVPEFEDAAFGIAKDGDIAKPIKTQFGWHIIKRMEQITLKSFEEEKKRIKMRVQRDTRSNRSREAFVSKVKKEYGFEEILKEKNDFYKVVDNTFFQGTWDVSKAGRLKAKLLVIGDKSYNQQDFAEYIASHQIKSPNEDARGAVDKLYGDFVNQVCVDYEDARLSEKYQEFRLLMKEYRDGILLFELTDQKVWSKAVKDTLGLTEFYEANKNNYMWDDRIKAIVYKCNDEKTAKKVKKLVKKKAKKGYKNEDILKMINTDSQLNLTIEENKYLKGDNPVVDAVEWKVGPSDVVGISDQYCIVEGIELLPKQPKEIVEAKGVITSDFQNYLEKEWVAELKAKYKVEVNKEVLDQVK